MNSARRKSTIIKLNRPDVQQKYVCSNKDGVYSSDCGGGSCGGFFPEYEEGGEDIFPTDQYTPALFFFFFFFGREISFHTQIPFFKQKSWESTKKVNSEEQDFLAVPARIRTPNPLITSSAPLIISKDIWLYIPGNMLQH